MTNDPAAYPHRHLCLSTDPDAGVRTVLLGAGCDPDAVMIDMFRDAIVADQHVLLAAQDRASLALAVASFRRLAEQPAEKIH